MCDDVDEQENECASYENRPCLAALARTTLSNPQPSHVTTVRTGCIQVKLGGFMMVSSLAAGPTSTSLDQPNGVEIDEVGSKPFRCFFFILLLSS